MPVLTAVLSWVEKHRVKSRYISGLQVLGDGNTMVPQLVDRFIADHGHNADGASRDSIERWVKRNAPWLSKATRTEFVPGNGRENKGTFRTWAIPNI